MKKILLSCSLLLSMLGCTKNVSNEPAFFPAAVTKNSPVQLAALPAPAVSAYGFLVFQTADDYAAFTNYVAEKTSGEVLAYYRQIGFVCLAQAQNNVGKPDEKIPEEKQYQFILDAMKMVQINGFVLKQSTDDKYLLTTSVKMLTSTTYQQLAGEQFNQTAMCRLAIMGTLSQSGTLLFDFLNNTLPGYSENPNPAVPMRKFWGRETIGYPCDNGHKLYITHYYAFGVEYKTEYDYAPC